MSVMCHVWHSQVTWHSHVNGDIHMWTGTGSLHNTKVDIHIWPRIRITWPKNVDQKSCEDLPMSTFTCDGLANVDFHMWWATVRTPVDIECRRSHLNVDIHMWWACSCRHSHVMGNSDKARRHWMSTFTCVCQHSHVNVNIGKSWQDQRMSTGM